MQAGSGDQNGERLFARRAENGEGGHRATESHPAAWDFCGYAPELGRPSFLDCLVRKADWGGFGGRYRTRTDDLFRVKEARYQLRQSPVGDHPATPREADRAGRSPRETRPIHPVWHPHHGSSSVSPQVGDGRRKMRMWRSGSASPCQGEGREFESRHPLEWGPSVTGGPARGGVAERRGSGLQSRAHGFESRRHLAAATVAVAAVTPQQYPITAAGDGRLAQR